MGRKDAAVEGGLGRACPLLPTVDAAGALPGGLHWPYGAAAWERLVGRATSLLGAPCSPVSWSPDPEGVPRMMVWRAPEGPVRVGWVGDVCVSLSWDGLDIDARAGLVRADGGPQRTGVPWEDAGVVGAVEEAWLETWPDRWSVGWASGTPWARAVWGAVLSSSCSLSYGDVARVLGRPGASRAVGRALGTNPLAPLVPCHLPVRGDGGLGGFRWGVGRKARWRARDGMSADDLGLN